MSVPTLNNTKSLTKYIREVNAHLLTLNQDKYNLLLDFINEWLKLDGRFKFSSLLEFKNMAESYLLADPIHNRKILRKYNQSIIDKLHINLTDKSDSNLRSKYILFFLTRSLVRIDYSLTRRFYGNEYHYTIRRK